MRAEELLPICQPVFGIYQIGGQLCIPGAARHMFQGGQAPIREHVPGGGRDGEWTAQHDAVVRVQHERSQGLPFEAAPARFSRLLVAVVLVLEREWGMGYDTLFALSIPMTVLFGAGPLVGTPFPGACR